MTTDGELREQIARLRQDLSKANTKIERLEFKNKKLEEEIERLKNKKRLTSPSARLRSSREYKAFRQIILNRDGNKCVKCGGTKNLQVHHIKEVCNYPELVMDSNNVITLCGNCHMQTDNYLTNKKGSDYYGKMRWKKTRNKERW